MAKKKRPDDFKYDVTLSFAGDDRPYVDVVAEGLVERGVRVFYDRYEEVGLWGKDLYTHLSDIYSNSVHYCVMFILKSYAKKLWTNHERKSAQELAFKANQEYILPVRFDNTAIPGLLDTVCYINLAEKTPDDFASLITENVV